MILHRCVKILSSINRNHVFNGTFWENISGDALASYNTKLRGFELLTYLLVFTFSFLLTSLSHVLFKTFLEASGTLQTSLLTKPLFLYAPLMADYSLAVRAFGEFTIDFEAVSARILVVLPYVSESDGRNEIFLFDGRTVIQVYAFLVREDNCLTLYFEDDCSLLGLDLALPLVHSDFFQSGGIITRAEYANVYYGISVFTFPNDFFNLR